MSPSKEKDPKLCYKGASVKSQLTATEPQSDEPSHPQIRQKGPLALRKVLASARALNFTGLAQNDGRVSDTEWLHGSTQASVKAKTVPCHGSLKVRPIYFVYCFFFPCNIWWFVWMLFPLPSSEDVFSKASQWVFVCVSIAMPTVYNKCFGICCNFCWFFFSVRWVLSQCSPFNLALLLGLMHSPAQHFSLGNQRPPAPFKSPWVSL